MISRFINKIVASFASNIRPIVLLCVVAFLWWLITAEHWVAPYLIPPPGSVFHTLFTKSVIINNTYITVYETVVGFILATIIGLGLAVSMVYSRTIEKTLYPILLFAQVIPKVSVAPLFIVWFGFGEAPKILLAVLISFFPIVISSVAGFRGVDSELLDLAATMGSSELRTFRKIRFPAALPQIFSGLKIGVTLAVTGAVVGEFVGSGSGLGYVLIVANGNMDASTLFATLIVLALMGIILFWLVQVAENILIPWSDSRESMSSTTI